MVDTPNESDRKIRVEMARAKWDVVLHVLQEELAQLVPPESDWLGKYPGEDSAVAVEDAHEEIAQSLNTGGNRDV